ncbi:DUF4184 family protein [Nocardia sp. IBHARD005]|uniref:DUF4184 family protein n=1 Tax=Nocardia sp. IBHARD005 TaxID=3457765 RepID=UPI004058681D
MPITFAHPVAVLPFARHLPLPALVAGSVAPDVVYYLPVSLSGSVTHSVIGILWWDLVIGLVVLSAFRVSEGPAGALLPFSLSVPADSGPAWRSAVRTVAAVLVGAATHVLWDCFTQTTGFAVRHWDVLRTTVVEPHRTYNVLGYVCSLAATAALAYLLVRRTRRACRTASASLRWRWVFVAVLLAAATTGAGLAVGDPVTRVSTYDLVRHTIIGAAQAAACAWVIYAVLWHIGASRKSSRRADTVEHEDG